MEFSTYNESSLHHTLKLLYAETYSGNTEVPLNGHIYDIVTKKGNIIEIQTKNLSALYNKIKDTIEKGRNIKIVHPIPITTTIELYDENNNLISKRKSPTKGSVYNIFKEMTKLYEFIGNNHFSLEVVEINMADRRVKTSEAVQSKNNKRRFKKNWIKTDKKLMEILTTTRFNSPEDYLGLLPKDLQEEFCAKDLKDSLKSNKIAPGKIYNNPHIILWVLNKAGLLVETNVKNRSHYFRIK